MALISMRDALNAALVEEMEKNDGIFLMGEEVGYYDGAYKVSRGLLQKFGERRVIDTPIAENGFAGVGIGAAMAGLRPVIEFMTFNFSLVAIDQIVNTAAKLRYMSAGQYKLPIVFRGPGGAPSQVGAQHSQALESYYAHVPGLKVVMPSTPKDAKGLLKSAIRDDNPVVFIESELLYNTKGEVPDEDFLIPLGKADVKRIGSDITLIAWSKSVTTALTAADLMINRGIRAEVIDLMSIRPLDISTILNSVKKTTRVLIVQESWPQASVGTWISSIINERVFDYLDAPVLVLSGEDCPFPYAKNLESLMLPTPESVVDSAMRLF